MTIEGAKKSIVNAKQALECAQYLLGDVSKSPADAAYELQESHLKATRLTIYAMLDLINSLENK